MAKTPKSDKKEEPTKEQLAAELQARMDGFNRELKPLLAKYELGISAVAVVMPDGRLAGNPILVDSRKKPEQPEKTKLSEA